MSVKPTPLSSRLLARVLIIDGCLVWQGARNQFGYGVIGRGGRAAGNVLTHRASWECVFGPIPADQYVLHRCDNPPCIEPTHLFLGSYADNVHDMIAKGRRPRRRVDGDRGPGAKLSLEQVAEIRRGTNSTMELSRLLGVTPGAVRKIRRGATWNSERVLRRLDEIQTSTRGVDISAKSYDGSDVAAQVAPAVAAYFEALALVQAKINEGAAK